jgi:hypothetical protein
MSQSHDRRAHADAVRRHNRDNHAARFKRQAGVMLASIAIGVITVPYAMLDPQEVQAASEYAVAKAKLWLASGTAVDPAVTISQDGQAYAVPARAVVAYRYYSGAARDVLAYGMWGGSFGLAAWLASLFLLRGAIAQRRERALRDRVIAGTLVTSEAQLAKLTSADSETRALTIGTVPIPSRLETRHIAMIGTTGSGKTTALRQLLDGIEARGEPALVYDTSGEFVAHYYRPERGDVILNPFDDRCAYWSPFAEIAHPADADRIAHQLITETGQHDSDVWLDTSRILVANMIRALWREGKCSLPDLLHALQDRTKDDLKVWLAGSSSARTFADDADRATGSVLFMLSKAADLIQFLRIDGSGGTPFAFRDFIHGLDKIKGARPWIFVPRKEDYFEASKPCSLAGWNAPPAPCLACPHRPTGASGSCSTNWPTCRASIIWRGCCPRGASSEQPSSQPFRRWGKCAIAMARRSRNPCWVAATPSSSCKPSTPKRARGPVRPSANARSKSTP